ncbi:MAG: lytic transglycosylase domain-containing protein [Methyloceanibacter sp.]|uniref:lytic transglycosylase domain-containing protein n=1 Tax=Methyloceanibacter sp. TaxID=1965321 RepID=UPI003C61F9E9
MKRTHAYRIALLMAFAWAVPACAEAKTETIPLPARNPERSPPVPGPTLSAEATAVSFSTGSSPSQSLSSQTTPSGQTPPATEATATKMPNQTTATKGSTQAADTTTIAAIPRPRLNTERAADEPANGNVDGASAEAAGAAAGDDKADTAENTNKADTDKEADATKLAAAPASFMPDTVPTPNVHPRRDPMSPAAPEPALDYGQILQPLLEYKLSRADESRVRFVMRHKGTVDDTAAKIEDPAAREFAFWYRYGHTKSSYLNAEAVEAYRKSHPMWPGLKKLREKAEASLFLTDASPERITAFFKDSEPETGAGRAALAGVYLKEGNKEKAEASVDAAWREDDIGQDTEEKILSKFSNMLDADDHRARVDVLLYPDKSKACAAALRVAKQLPEAEQKKVKARVAVVKRDGNAGKLLKALPDDAVKKDLGLRFNNIQWLRRTKDKEQRLIAWKLLLDVPQEPDLLLDMKEWWIERRVNVRAALNDGHPRTAYEIAAKHGLAAERHHLADQYVEAEFLAGWVSLRYLNEPQTALRHFLSMRRGATDSRDIARSEYWLGRTALVLGDRGSAAVHFHVAAKYPQYFYGQLGRQALDPRPARLEVTATPVPTQEDIDRFMGREAVRALGVARAIGVGWVTPQFLLSLSRTLDNAAEVVLLAEFAKLVGHKQMALRLSKIAFNRDLPMGDYALPVGVMPSFKSLVDERVDPALVHALSRQESEFNAAAQSPVGASGLMQLMPATARGVARRYKVKYSKAKLTNPAYNTQLGEAFLNDLITNYDGSYFMALAAYNAGPGRVKEWVGIYGDPRGPDVDPVDWIERIPFTETRRYVIKIMETLQLYRSRLAGPEKALHLVQDLNRGRRVPASETASVQPASEAPKTP